MYPVSSPSIVFPAVPARIGRGSDRGPVQTAVLVVMLLTGCGRPPSDGASTAGPTQHPAMAPLDYLSVQGQGKRRAENVIALVQVQKAIQEFQATENRWPTDLEELVRAGFLASVPGVPAGQRFDYDPAAGAVRMAPVAR